MKGRGNSLHTGMTSPLPLASFGCMILFFCEQCLLEAWLGAQPTLWGMVLPYVPSSMCPLSSVVYISPDVGHMPQRTGLPALAPEPSYGAGGGGGTGNRN